MKILYWLARMLGSAGLCLVVWWCLGRYHQIAVLIWFVLAILPTLVTLALIVIKCARYVLELLSLVSWSGEWQDVEHLFDRFRLIYLRIRAELTNFQVRVVRFAIWLLVIAFIWCTLQCLAWRFGIGSVHLPVLSWSWMKIHGREIFALGTGWSSWWPIKIVLAAILIDRTGVLLGCIWKVVLRAVQRWRRKKKGDVRRCPVASDTPLDVDASDLLNRAAYIETVAALMRSAPVGTSAQYIGLYGTWGEGKSSVLPRLQRTLRYEGYAFVTFTLWEYADRSRLPELLFNKIASQERLCLERSLPGLLRMFGRRLMLSPDVLRDVPFLGGWLARAQSEWYGLERVRYDLKEALRKHKGRIVVVLDDLDRLLSDDIYELIRLIKANGDLPNVTYLVLADREYLAAALAEKLPSNWSVDERLNEGRRYLEKILPLECNLPQVLGVRYVGLFKTMLANQVRLPKGFDVDKWSADVVAPFLKTMRNVKRLVNAIAVQWTFQLVRGGGLPKVDFSDLIALMAVKLFARPFYDALMSNVHLIKASTKDTSTFQSDNPGRTREWVRATFMTGCSNKDEPALMNFLSTVMCFRDDPQSAYLLMPHSSGAHDPGHFFYTPPGEAALKACRLAAGQCFWNYFVGDEEDPTPQPDPLWRQFLSNLSDPKVAGLLLIGLDDEKVLRRFLKEFNSKFASELTMEAGVPAVLALSYAVEGLAANLRYDWTLAHVGRDNFGVHIIYRITGCVLRILSAFSDDNGRFSSEVIRRLEQQGHVLVLAHLIASYDKRLVRRMDAQAYGRLKNVVVKFICERQGRGKLLGCVDELALRRAWMLSVGVDKEKQRQFRSAQSSDLSSYPNVIHVLSPFFVMQKRWRGERIVVYDERSLCQFFPQEHLLVAYESLVNARLKGRYEASAKLALGYLLNIAKGDKERTVEAQVAYVRAHLR